ncbi:hypothetical protein Q427_08610 [Halomonas sp. BC04]|nr:hypothetical protein Q427_08610 [Halomonas sp. BC04]
MVEPWKQVLQKPGAHLCEEAQGSLQVLLVALVKVASAEPEVFSGKV